LSLGAILSWTGLSPVSDRLWGTPPRTSNPRDLFGDVLWRKSKINAPARDCAFRHVRLFRPHRRDAVRRKEVRDAVELMFASDGQFERRHLVAEWTERNTALETDR